MIGAVPLYERICGVAEVSAGVLLLVRNTSLAGALLTAFVMTNVLLYNLFFDVPVKLFAGYLVLFASFLILADAKPLFRFFVLNQAAEPKGVWVPPASRTGILRGMKIAEIGYLLLALGSIGSSVRSRWTMVELGQKPSPLLGAWCVKDASPSALKTAEGSPWTHIYFDSTDRPMVRDRSGQLWRYNLKYDAAKATLEMRGPTDLTQFTWHVEDSDHLILKAVLARAVSLTEARGWVALKDAAAPQQVKPAIDETLRLERQPTAKSYVLYERGFHWVNEWGYEH